jgi:signal transduction protein with GAF and PtsI domain
MRREKSQVSYETLARITNEVSSARKLERVAEKVVKALTQELGLKGCALLLLERRSKRLELAAAHGLSRRYLEKGPISAVRSIAESLGDEPVAIYEVAEDPRLQYPREAQVEGIASILSVPVRLRGRSLGVLRLYTAEPWEFSFADITFVQAVAQILALVLDNLRVAGAYKTALEALKGLRAA